CKSPGRPGLSPAMDLHDLRVARRWNRLWNNQIDPSVRIRQRPLRMRRTSVGTNASDATSEAICVSVPKAAPDSEIATEQIRDSDELERGERIEYQRDGRSGRRP